MRHAEPKFQINQIVDTAFWNKVVIKGYRLEPSQIDQNGRFKTVGIEYNVWEWKKPIWAINRNIETDYKEPREIGWVTEEELILYNS
jgi:hypothetical protein